jgi:hypothetical protein
LNPQSSPTLHATALQVAGWLLIAAAVTAAVAAASGGSAVPFARVLVLLALVASLGLAVSLLWLPVAGWSRLAIRLPLLGGEPLPFARAELLAGGAAALDKLRSPMRRRLFVFGQDYGGTVFTETSASIEKDWGRNGVPDKLEPYAAERKVADVTLCVDFQQAALAIQNAYPVAVCSMRGFDMTLRNGVLTPSGQWAHAMMFCGLRWKPKPQLYLANSWGDCYRGTYDETLPAVFQRSGGWVDADVCTSMLKGEDSFALAGFQGFKPRSLPDWTGGVL